MESGDLEAMMVAMEINVEESRRSGRSKNIWIERIENDMKIAGESK